VSSASDVDVLEPTTGTRWDAVLSGIRADGLDCLQSTVAVIADEAYGPGTHLAMGCRWRFPVRDADGGVGVQPSFAERTIQATDVLGLRVGEPVGPLSPAELRGMADTEPVYVIAEAYDLRWLPYARATVRYREMPHSFLLERAADGYTVVDAYYADTEWGRARPSTWTLSAAELDRAVAGVGTATRMAATGVRPRIDPASVMAGNAATARAAGPDIEDYLTTARDALGKPEGIERLVLDIWHLCRERLLYTVWLDTVGIGGATAEAAAGAVQRWQQLAGQSYLASRRARRGAPPNYALIDEMARLLHSDAALMATLADTLPAPGRTSVEGAVLDAVRTTLDLDAAAVELTSPLRMLPGYDSFQLVRIIDRIETGLGVEFPPDPAAADLVDVAGLCRLFARAVEDQRS